MYARALYTIIKTMLQPLGCVWQLMPAVAWCHWCMQLQITADDLSDSVRVNSHDNVIVHDGVSGQS
jgi:hypothetical protein